MLNAKAMRLGCWDVFVAVSVAMLSGPLAAQTMPSQTIPRGTRVRVSLKASPENRLVGIADTMKSDGLSWRPMAGDSSVTLSLSAINTLELSNGRHSHAGKGAVIGGATIGTIGFMLFAAMAEAPRSDLMRLEGGWHDALLLTAGATAAGALGGAIIGSMFSSEHWQEIPLGGVRVAPISLGRFGVTVSLRL